TAALPSPQQMRDRLLQAVDAQSNIRDTATVLEVISILETYPITKKALEDTRLGRVINNVRKQSQNQEVAQRAKKLLRSWQKFLEPLPRDEVEPRRPAGAAGRVDGGAPDCRPRVGSAGPGKTLGGAKNPQDLRAPPDERLEKEECHKRRQTKSDVASPGPLPKVPRSSREPLVPSSSPLTTGGIPGPHSSSGRAHQEDRQWKPNARDGRRGKSPVKEARPRTGSAGRGQTPGPCLQEKAEVLQQQPRGDKTPCPPQPKRPLDCSFRPGKSPLGHSSAGPQSSRAPRTSVPIPSPLTQVLHAGQVSPSQPSMPTKRRTHMPATGERPAPCLEQAQGHQGLAGTGLKAELSPEAAEPLLPGPGSRLDSRKGDRAFSSSGGSDNTKGRHRPHEGTVKMAGQGAQANEEPVQLKKRKLSFDPVTRQVKTLTQKQPERTDSPVQAERPRAELERPEAKAKAKASLPSPFQQRKGKELSAKEMIPSDLHLQISPLPSWSSSSLHAPGARPLVPQYLKQEENTRPGAPKQQVLVPQAPHTDLPGLTREVTRDDVHRIQACQWPGVNGCQDTQGNWYNWTQCMSVDREDGSGPLTILPYVCLD
uniref:Mediator of RNA polymerase II transcription subunit 26 n=1 Tax=Otolemur garnettii TaxID=30611 RepID=H0XU31_OTOGA